MFFFQEIINEIGREHFDDKAESSQVESDSHQDPDNLTYEELHDRLSDVRLKPAAEHDPCNGCF